MGATTHADGVPLLGLARRAGAIVMGTDAVRSALRAGKVDIVILASDGADGQIGKVEGLSRHRFVPVRWVPSRVDLGAAVGSGPLTAIAVRGPSFAEALERVLPDRRGGRVSTEEDAGSDAGR